MCVYVYTGIFIHYIPAGKFRIQYDKALSACYVIHRVCEHLNPGCLLLPISALWLLPIQNI